MGGGWGASDAGGGVGGRGIGQRRGKRWGVGVEVGVDWGWASEQDKKSGSKWEKAEGHRWGRGQGAMGTGGGEGKPPGMGWRARHRGGSAGEGGKSGRERSLGPGMSE